MTYRISTFLFFLAIFASLGFVLVPQTNDPAVVYKTELIELTDREYPNNPDKKNRSRTYTKVDYNSLSITANGDLHHIEILPADAKYPKVTFKDVNLMEFIPTIPDHVKSDEYMSLVAVVNQEWNRNQVTFKNNHFSVEPGKKKHKHRISRVDIARSCLNSYLWEVFFYTYNATWRKHELMYHGWFNFPEELYQSLFEKRNGVEYATYAEYLEEWKDLPSESIDFDLLREVVTEKTVAFEDLSDEMYPIEGERLKKKDEIIKPRAIRRMSDFHTDKAAFSSFIQPGMYVKKERRATKLSRFQKLEKATVRRTINAGKEERCLEVELDFTNDKGQFTKMTIGGIDLYDTTIVIEEKANDGDLYPMGIGNHTFYENYMEQQSYSSKDNAYFGILTDEEGKFLDSHLIGIDGPLIHKDANNQNILHVWLLSYERHALVGHYEIHLD